MMRNKILLGVAGLLIIMGTLLYTKFRHTDNDPIQKILDTHYAAYHDSEYFSGIALSFYVPRESIRSYFSGYEAHDKNAKPVSADTLFEIGSITKSFTSAVILQLEKENKLKLTDTLQHWLPEYDKWSQLTLESMLNMTSGLPNYSDSPLMNAQVFQHPEQAISGKDLIAYVYPSGALSPPLKPGYAYTNTGYILAGMIIEKLTNSSLQSAFMTRLILPAHLENTFYPLPQADKRMSRLAHGYGFNPYANPELVGKDLRDSTLSWAGAAGAMISNSADVIQWVKALFVDTAILDPEQKKKLMKLVSTETGKFIPQTSSHDPRAFALGVSQGYDPEIGEYWFYEGETEGFRALYMFVPANGIIISSIFNSAVNSENDHAGELMKKIYQKIKPA